MRFAFFHAPTECNAFHVLEAVGGPYIPAQKDSVIPYGVESVLRFASMSQTADVSVIPLSALPRMTAYSQRAS